MMTSPSEEAKNLIGPNILLKMINHLPRKLTKKHPKKEKSKIKIALTTKIQAKNSYHPKILSRWIRYLSVEIIPITLSTKNLSENQKTPSILANFQKDNLNNQ